MVTLFWDSRDFGNRFSERLGIAEIKAHYDSLENAKAQALHDKKLGKRPLRIEDDKGKVLWKA